MLNTIKLAQSGDIISTNGIEKEDSKSISYKSKNSNSLERTPKKDEFNKKELGTGAKLGIGLVSAVALFVIGDYVFCKGKHVKNILGKSKSKTESVVSQTGSKLDNTERLSRIELFKNNEIKEFTMKENENTFKVVDNKIVEYKNKDGQDLLHTFEKTEGPDYEYKKIIEKLIDDVNKREKEALKKIDNVKVKNSEEIITASDIKYYLEKMFK